MSSSQEEQHRPSDVPEAEWAKLLEIPRMTSLTHLEYLYNLGASWKGSGLAVECGCWMGASTSAFGLGLKRAGYDKPLYCFDRWEAHPRQVVKAAKKDIELEENQNIEPYFRAHVESFFDNVKSHRGEISRAKWGGEPIEIFLMDAAKREPEFSRTLGIFGPSFIPGKTTIVFMDFYLYRKHEGRKRKKYECQERFLDRHADCFEPLEELQTVKSVRYVKPVAWNSWLGSIRTRLDELFA